jgi:hypothetical protein
MLADEDDNIIELWGGAMKRDGRSDAKQKKVMIDE